MMTSYKNLNQQEAHKKLIKVLQNAHAGEKAAANAYFGHAYSFLFVTKKEKKEILKIYQEELDHRAEIKIMLQSLGQNANLLKELVMFMTGFVIGLLCPIGGWFIPMYGAGLLENQNIGEYEHAARLAYLAGHKGLIETLLHFAEVEADHELYFREKATSHWACKWVPIWKKAKTYGGIRGDFEGFKKNLEA